MEVEKKVVVEMPSLLKTDQQSGSNARLVENGANAQLVEAGRMDAQPVKAGRVMPSSLEPDGVV